MGADNPYVGARPFTAEQRVFGRDRERRDIVALVIAERVLLLYSPSGAGKTSVLQGQGGVIDTLRDEGFFVLPIARVGLPSPAPSENRYLDSLLASIEEDDASGPDLQRALAACVDAHADAVGVVLIIDQFEEILTVDPTGAAERAAFFHALGGALENRRVWAILALREEHLGALTPYRQAIPTHLRTTYRLDLLSVEAAGEAILRPAREAGVPFTGAAAEKLIRELCAVTVPRPDGAVERKLGASVEPVELQVVCHRLWMRRRPGADQIGEDDIDAVESVDSALADYYAAAVAEAARASGAGERRIRAWIEQVLITKRGVRSQVMRYGERESGLPDKAIDALVDVYVLRQDMRRGVAWIELAHDRLIKPICQDNAAFRLEHLSVVEGQAERWEARGRDEELCLRGKALAEAERWAADHHDELTDAEAQFLSASRKADQVERERRRRQWWIMAALIAVAFAVTTGALGVHAWVSGQRAEEARIAQRNTSLLAGARELLARDQPASAVKLLLAARSFASDPRWIDLAGEVLAKNHLRVTLRGHTRDVPYAAFSPDGRRVVTASEDGTARVWSADGRGAPVVLRGHTAELVSAAWSPDGARIVTASLDHTARVWSAEGGREQLILKGHEGKVTSAGFSPDGRWILTASWDGTARVWDANDGATAHVLRGHEDKVVSAAWSPDGQRIVTASFDNTARVWSAASGREQLRLKGHEDKVATAAWSPDGMRIVTASFDQTARVWSAADGRELVRLKGHEDKVRSAAWSPDGKRILTASQDWTARVWDAAEGKEIAKLRGHADGLQSAAWSPDGTRVVTASWDGSARIWAPAGGEPMFLEGHEGRVWTASFSADGERVVTASEDRTARVWDARRAQARPPAPRGDLGYSSMLGPRLRRFVEGLRDGSVRVWGLDATVLLHWKAHDQTSRWPKFSPDGTKIVTASDDHTARVWSAEDGRPLLVLRGHEGAVTTAAFSDDGAKIVTGSEDATARVWSAADGRELLVLQGHRQTVMTAAFSRDGTKIVTGSADATARVWSAEDGRSLATLFGHRSAVASAAFSPDGARIVTGSYDDTARVWSVTGGDRIVLRGHVGPLQVTAFSADGTKIVTGSVDTTARVWWGDRFSRSYVFRGHTSAVDAAAFVPGHPAIITVSDENAVKVWTWDVGDLLRALRGTNDDCLSPDLRTTYLGEQEAGARSEYEACERLHGRTPEDEP